MKQVVRKLYGNFEKEEKWLNEMSAKGLQLVDYTIGRYVFEEGKPGEYIYRIQLLDNLPKHAESMAYLRFMEESGVECVATYFRWVFFRKKAEDGPFDLYSDYESKIKHYSKVLWLTSVVWFLNLAAGLYNVIIGLTIGREHNFYLNLYISTISWTLAVLLGMLIFSYLKKLRKLKKEKQLYE